MEIYRKTHVAEIRGETGQMIKSIGRAASMKKARDDAQADAEAFRVKEEEKFLEASKKVRTVISRARSRVY